jgi:hypothetical protein
MTDRVPIVIPIAQTAIYWRNWLEAGTKFLGQSPASELDRRGIPVESLWSFLETIKEFGYTHHVHFTFCGTCYLLDYYQITHGEPSLNSQFKKQPDERCFFIVSSTLHGWQDAILTKHRIEQSMYVRLFYEQILKYFASIQLEETVIAGQRTEFDLNGVPYLRGK